LKDLYDQNEIMSGKKKNKELWYVCTYAIEPDALIDFDGGYFDTMQRSQCIDGYSINGDIPMPSKPCTYVCKRNNKIVNVPIYIDEKSFDVILKLIHSTEIYVCRDTECNFVDDDTDTDKCTMCDMPFIASLHE
jgi:hypothetical protein